MLNNVKIIPTISISSVGICGQHAHIVIWAFIDIVSICGYNNHKRREKFTIASRSAKRIYDFDTLCKFFGGSSGLFHLGVY